MLRQQQHITAQSIIIPFDRLCRYSRFIGLENKVYDYIQYRQCLQLKPKTVYGAYSSQSLIKLLRAIQDNSGQFMQILAINTTLTKSNKKQFVIDKLLRQYCQFSYQDLLNQLKYIKQQLKNKSIYQQMINFIILIIKKVKYLLYKYCQTLVMVLGQCINFYIRRTKIYNNHHHYLRKSSNNHHKQSNNNSLNNLQSINQQLNNLQSNNNSQSQQPQYQYSLIMGFDKICVSFCSSNQYCQNIINTLSTKLRDHCLIHGFDIDQSSFNSQNIQPSHSNLFQSQQIPQHLIQCYAKKLSLIQEKTASQPNSQILYTTIVLNTLTKYAQDIYFLIQGTIVFLANLVLQKKQLKSITYDQQYISMHDPLNNKDSISQTFMNLYCQHFQGLPQQLYKNGQKCPYCSQPIIVDEIKCFQRNRNIFQLLLARNYLNPKSDDVIYYFKDKIFVLATKQKFASYAHFCQFIKKHYFVRDRPQVLMILQNQKISLYSKLWGKKKLFLQQQLIQTPVRGKYCRHLQFFELMRVYEKYITRQPHQTSFQCFLCYQQIQYTQILYLHEIKLLIDLARQNFYTTADTMLNSYVQINHTAETVELCCQLEKGYMKKAYKLNIYQTLMDPLSKSQKNQDKNQQKKEQQLGEFQFNQEFNNFFFGY